MSLYETNETMRLIGKQFYSEAVTEKGYRQIKDILSAHIKCNRLEVIDIMTNVFIAGYIHGIRHERARRKDKQ